MNDSSRMCQIWTTPKIDEQRQRGRRRHLDVLRGQQRPAAIAAVRQHAADEREEHDRQLLQEGIEPEEEGRARQRQDHPVLGGRSASTCRCSRCRRRTTAPGSRDR